VKTLGFQKLEESLREPFQKVLSVCVGMSKFSRENFPSPLSQRALMLDICSFFVISSSSSGGGGMMVVVQMINFI
jgi:hypothetical protein